MILLGGRILLESFLLRYKNAATKVGWFLSQVKGRESGGSSFCLIGDVLLWPNNLDERPPVPFK